MLVTFDIADDLIQMTDPIWWLTILSAFYEFRVCTEIWWTAVISPKNDEFVIRFLTIIFQNAACHEKQRIDTHNLERPYCICEF